MENVRQQKETVVVSEIVRREQARKWREEHADFIAAYNATIAAEGLPLDAFNAYLHDQG